ncbi:MAG: deoxyribodipyrimidine photo-lyase [Paucibacter sp.]|nr:deoxyribodipyrimidine photo-lyase [Roseateles sp.]
MRTGTALVWLRRDLRLSDHAALAQALHSGASVQFVFVFDTDILKDLPRMDRRVAFIHATLAEIDQGLRALLADAGLLVGHGRPVELIPRLAAELGAAAVFANHDDEPAALERDAEVARRLALDGRRLRTGKDHVIFERSELLTSAGKPYTIFTPYKNAWLRRISHQDLVAHASEGLARALAKLPPGWRRGMPALAELGFEPAELPAALGAGSAGAEALFDDFESRMDRYAALRDFPAQKGPSYLSTHLRFGTVSIRRLARSAYERMLAGDRGAEVWLSELIWRDFYHQLMHHHPYAMKSAFKPEYDAIQWEQGPKADAHFQAWCEGRTGYPLVDAGMLQLRESGYMHNRLRMVAASFLVKHLGLDWRRGEAYFAEQLLDFDLAANNGGWQWAASTGCDAQPWFRIFNPVLQSQRFDPEGRFIKRYLPQLAALDAKHVHRPWRLGPALTHPGYPAPIVDHAAAREKTLARFAAVKKRLHLNIAVL